MRVILIYGYGDMNLDGSVILCEFSWIIIVVLFLCYVSFLNKGFYIDLFY